MFNWFTFPRWHSGEESACQCRRRRRCKFSPWIGKIPWSRKWQPTPIFLLWESHGQRNLAVYSPWGRKDSDMTEWLSAHSHTHTHTHTPVVKSILPLCTHSFPYSWFINVSVSSDFLEWVMTYVQYHHCKYIGLEVPREREAGIAFLT